MYNHTLHYGKMMLLFTSFQYRRNIKIHLKSCFKINGKQNIIMPKNSQLVKFKNYSEKIKLLIIIQADFESILEPEYNGK